MAKDQETVISEKILTDHSEVDLFSVIGFLEDIITSGIIIVFNKIFFMYLNQNSIENKRETN